MIPCLEKRAALRGRSPCSPIFHLAGQSLADATAKREDRYRFARFALETTVMPSLRVSAFVQPSQAEVADLLMAVEIENLQVRRTTNSSFSRVAVDKVPLQDLRGVEALRWRLTHARLCLPH